MHFETGEHIVLRHFHEGRVGYVYPVTVAVDNEDYCALHLAAGTGIIERKMPDGSSVTREVPYAERYAAGVHTGIGEWRENSVLQLTKTDEAHSFWAFRRDSDGRFLGWYVNLQSPLRRSKVGFDTEDHILDIVVSPDGSWKWKDRDELEEAVSVGRFTRQEADDIRSEGGRAVRKIEAGEWPIGSDWEDWLPASDWSIPPLERHWEQI